MPGAREAAVELERGDHERPSTKTSPEVAEDLHAVRRVGGRGHAAHALVAGAALGVEVVAAGRDQPRGSCPSSSAARAAAARSRRRRRCRRSRRGRRASCRSSRRSSIAPAAGQSPARCRDSRGSSRRRRWCGRRRRRCRARRRGRPTRHGPSSEVGQRDFTPKTLPRTRRSVTGWWPKDERSERWTSTPSRRPPPTITMSPSPRSKRQALERAGDRVGRRRGRAWRRTRRSRARPLRPPRGGPRSPRHGPTAKDAPTRAYRRNGRSWPFGQDQTVARRSAGAACERAALAAVQLARALAEHQDGVGRGAQRVGDVVAVLAARTRPTARRRPRRAARRPAGRTLESSAASRSRAAASLRRAWRMRSGAAVIGISLRA